MALDIDTVTAGEVTSAAKFNKLKTALDTIWKGTTAGDMDYYAGATSKTRLALGNPFDVLMVHPTEDHPSWNGVVGARVYYSGAQSISNNSITAVSSFTSETFDYGDFHTGTAGTIVIPTGYSGVYAIHVSGYFDSHATANKYREIGIQLDGSGVSIAFSTVNDGASATWMNAFAIFQLSESQTVGLVVTQKSGASINFNNPYLTVIKLK